MASLRLTVIDEFYPNPIALREQAISSSFDIGGGNPGLSTINIDVKKHMKHVGKMLNIEPDYEHLKFINLFRMTKGSDQIRDTDIHVDGPCFAGVGYLNLPEQCSGGTTFFKHKKTGLEMWPNRRQTNELSADGKLPKYASGEKRSVLYWEEQGRDRSNWEPVIHVQMKFNRALFFDGRQFHTMTSWREFGDSPETARITMVYFFHQK